MPLAIGFPSGRRKPLKSCRGERSRRASSYTRRCWWIWIGFWRRERCGWGRAVGDGLLGSSVVVEEAVDELLTCEDKLERRDVGLHFVLDAEDSYLSFERGVVYSAVWYLAESEGIDVIGFFQRICLLWMMLVVGQWSRKVFRHTTCTCASLHSDYSSVLGEGDRFGSVGGCGKLEYVFELGAFGTMVEVEVGGFD